MQTATNGNNTKKRIKEKPKITPTSMTLNNKNMQMPRDIHCRGVFVLKGK